MGDDGDFTINEGTYDLIVRSFETVQNRLGLNIRVHKSEGSIKQGQIFLFNHFARFETVIPPLIVHRATGAYCRSIADYALFEGSETFDKLLRSVGAIPNNQPGLLAFLAAEILRGRKVVIFPEGGMVKDRQVVDEAGDFGIFSRTAEARRKHHRGAAVLAQTLEIFKRRIRDLFADEDMARLERWATSLDLENIEILRERAHEPTLIVPTNITFYPIRIEENILSRGAELLAKGLPDQFIEELVIEGNLLLRDTDMDIRLGQPVEPQVNWRWWERLMLRRYFLRVTSLDELFGLRENAANSLAEKMLAKSISAETFRIRDEAMANMYAAITVNLSHLAASYVSRLVARDVVEIDVDTFHRGLYLALKYLQAAPEVHLHRSLFWPDRYRGLLDGDSSELDRFMVTCEKAGLIECAENSYRFTDKLKREQDFDTIRLENPLSVYANEVAPVPGVGAALDAALEKLDTVTESELAAFLFDDELRAHDWNKRHYATHKYLAINAEETASESGAPYLLLPEGKSGEQAEKGVLLVHGFLASPAELAAYGKSLCADGYAVMGVRLAGHGTSPWDLKSRSWQEWLNSVRRGYRIISAFADQVFVVGFSTGGILALMLAAEHPLRLGGVAAVSAPLYYRNRQLAFVPLVHGLNKISDWLPSFEGVMPFRENESEHPEINYRNMPIQGLYQLRLISEELPEHLPKITVPTLILQGDNDPIVEPDSARDIFNKLTMRDKALHWIMANRHGILNEDTGNTRSLLADFIARARGEEILYSRHNPPPHPRARPVFSILDDSVARRQNNSCLDFLGKLTSYSEIGDLVARAAKGLQNLGVKKGDRVGLCLPNSPYYVIAYFATLKIGATVVNFNPLYTASEIRGQIIDSGTTLMVTIDLKTIFPKVEAALEDTSLGTIVVCSLSDALPAVKELLFNVLKRSQLASISDDLRLVSFERLTSQGSKFTPVEIDPHHDIAVLQYTGGTTGTPKGAMLSHANVMANTEQVKLWMGETTPGGERILCVIPFFHVFAMTAALNLGIATGSELILLPRFELQDVLKTIDAKQPTLFPAVPTIFNAINAYDDLARFDLSAIRFCISGGAPLPAAVKASFENLTGCVVVEGYGLTEASPVVSCNPPDGENKPDSIGLPLPWTEIEIRDLDNPGASVATGERGELAIKGPQVMRGYINRAAETAEVLKDGWLMTGDVGYVDEAGYLFLTDRLKDVIFCSGFKVYPRVIEEAFYQHADVDEVIVIGIPDDYRGETPKAFVKLKAGATIIEVALLEFVAAHLNPIERPDSIEFRDELPKTMIGKLSKKELVLEHQQQLEEVQHE